MTGLKKLLLSFLVICTLGYGSAWAYDGHAVEIDSNVFLTSDVQNSSQVTTQTSLNQISQKNHLNNEQDTEQHPNVKASCNDHCGHISAHLQAIFTQNSHLVSLNQTSELSEYSEAFISYIFSPDLRPPRI